MSKFRRYYIPNALVFITAVTRDRRPIFADEHNTDLLLATMRRVQAIHPFGLMAYVVLPDHVHLLMKTEATMTFSGIMQSIKWNYTRNYKAARSITDSVSLWQDRFWDHVIRDEADLSRHVDYIHYNPVKHGHSDAPGKWRFSTFSFWAERGYYLPGWGATEPPEIASLEME